MLLKTIIIIIYHYLPLFIIIINYSALNHKQYMKYTLLSIIHED